MTAGVLLVIAALLLHLVEEVATGFRKRLPVGEMPLSLFVGINVLIYTFCLTTLICAARGSRLTIPLAWVLSAAMSLNGLGHLGAMIVRRAYFPGGATALPLLLAALHLALVLLKDGH